MNNKKDVIDDIDLIKRMVNESQGFFPFKSNHFMLWGLAIPLATLITLIMDIQDKESYIGLVWGIVCGISTIISIIMGINQKPSHKTTISSIYSVVWICLLISNVIIITSLFLGLIPLNIVLAFISLLLGMAFFITGFMKKDPLIKIVAVLWYILAVIMIIVKNDNSGYIMGISTFFLNFVPGLILRKKNE